MIVFNTSVIFMSLSLLIGSITITEAQDYQAIEQDNIVHYHGLNESFNTIEMYKIYLENNFENRIDSSLTSKQARDNDLVPLKNEIHLKLAESLPADLRFKVVTVYETEDGYLAALVNSNQYIDYETVKKNNAVVDIIISHEAAHTFPAVVEGEDYSIKDLDTSSSINKEDGYRQIIEHFQEGHQLAKVSMVFEKKSPTGIQPYRRTIVMLEEHFRGNNIYGYNFNNEKKIAWHTQELELDQVHELYKNDLVINLILHTD